MLVLEKQEKFDGHVQFFAGNLTLIFWSIFDLSSGFVTFLGDMILDIECLLSLNSSLVGRICGFRYCQFKFKLLSEFGL